jgi:Protein of unknown function (DUF1573)
MLLKLGTMKKSLFLAAAIALLPFASMAAKHRHHGKKHAHPVGQTPMVAKGAVMTFHDGTTADLKKVKKDSRVTTVFQFKNTGDKPLFIDNVTSFCSCISLKWDVEPVLPGGKGHIVATFDSHGVTGDFFKEINILSNGVKPAYEKYTTVIVSGTVETESYQAPDQMTAGR